jgi:hypothetical protein
MRTLPLLVVGIALSCASARRSPSDPPPPASDAPAEPPAASIADKPPSSGSDTPGASAPASASAPVTLPFTFTLVQATAVSSLATGKPPKIAALAAGEAFVFDGTSLSRISVPETRGPELSVEIFFGRDDQPRLMGYRRTGSTDASRAAPYYRRYKGGRFQPEPSELGPLAAPEGALYGVLGHADPEVVCRPGQFCLVKRTTGWGRAPAHAEPVRILLAGPSAWALHRDRIERLDRDRWVALTPERAWGEPVSLFVDTSGAVWVVEAKKNAVTRLAGDRWETMPVPLQRPRAIWATAPSDVWLVGEGGAAHFDGRAWALVPGVSGPLALILHSPPNLWLAGGAGLFRGSPTTAN